MGTKQELEVTKISNEVQEGKKTVKCSGSSVLLTRSKHNNNILLFLSLCFNTDLYCFNTDLYREIVCMVSRRCFVANENSIKIKHV